MQKSIKAFLFLSLLILYLPAIRVIIPEEDSPAPVNFYGKTKAEAEDAVKEYEYGFAIVRTSLVYGKPLAGRSNILSIVRENWKIINLIRW